MEEILGFKLEFSNLVAIIRSMKIRKPKKFSSLSLMCLQGQSKCCDMGRKYLKSHNARCSKIRHLSLIALTNIYHTFNFKMKTNTILYLDF